MSRIIRSIIDENPLYALCDQLTIQLSGLLENQDLVSFSEDSISYGEFARYLVFESISEHIKQQQAAKDSHPLYAHIKEQFEKDEESCTALIPEEVLKKVSKDFSLRMKFQAAKLKRHELFDIPDVLADYEGMKARSNRRYGYNITPIQYQQLTDKDDFYIKKVHELRRFRNAKHAPKEDVIRYYNSLFEHAKECRNGQTAKERVISAINLNDFENENLSLFLYYISRYCYEHDISNIDESSELYLGILSGSLSYTTDGHRLLSTHKPILFLNQYISSALNYSIEEIRQYILIRLYGLMIRKSWLADKMGDLEYSYKDIDQFICALYGYDYYNIYSYYSVPNLAGSNSIWDDKGKIVSILRDLINRLTIDPLSEK